MANISIALAIYNGEKYLEKQLISLVNQTLSPSEIVIVDDCSTDNSKSIIDRFNFHEIPVRYYRNPQNLGVNATFKRLIGLCLGDYIATCDQDDIWLPDKLQKSYNSIIGLDNNLPCVAYTDLSIIDETDHIIEPSLYTSWGIDPSAYPFKLILFDNVIIGCTAFFNKEMQKAIGEMPTNVIMHDYWIALIGYSFGNYTFNRDVTILYRSHGNSVTSKKQKTKIQNIFTDLQNRKKYLKKNLDQAETFLRTYYQFLNEEDRKSIKSFLSLKSKPFLYRRLYAKFLKLSVTKLNAKIK